MTSPKPQANEDERLPMLLGFQRVAANTARETRFMEHGKGIYLYDTDGREYIEATSSFYVAALGYQHAELIDAITAQYHELPFFVSAMHRTSKTTLDLAERLVNLVPVADAHLVFATTGSEAIDFLVKMLRFQAVARGTPKRTTVISRHDSYHGGTLAAASLTGAHHDEFGLPLPGFLHTAQPDFHGHRIPGETATEFSLRLGHELDALITSQPADSVCAFFAEPVSFSAGFKLPPAEYFPAIARVLESHGVAFVADEVVTGFGRTGTWFGSESFALRPDHITMGKAITGGYFPFSAIAIGAGLYADLDRGSEAVGTLAHAATYAAHPVGAAAALKVMEIMQRDNLLAHGRAMGEHLARQLHALTDHPLIGDVRSHGLAACVDFLIRDASDAPVNDARHADAICEEVYSVLLDAGVVARPAGRSLVLAPPLIIQASEIDEIIRRLKRSLDVVLARLAK